MRRRIEVGCLFLLIAGLATAARADLVISIQSTTVAAGGTGVLDVYLTSTASSMNPDFINNLGFELQITNNGVDNTQLAFSATQSFGYLNSSSPPYVFLGDSFDYKSGSAGGIVSPTGTVYPYDTFTGSDSTFSGNPVSLSSGTTYLLASLTLTTATFASPNIGDSFTVSLVPSSGSGSANGSPPPTTFFDNFNFDTGGETSATPFTSLPGTVMITGSAVPEPASIVSATIGIVILAGFHGVRRLRRSK
jgi:hypothetical protein